MPQVQPNRNNTLNGLLSRVVTQHGPPQQSADGSTLTYPGGTSVQNRGDHYYVGVPNVHKTQDGRQIPWGYRIHTFDSNGNARPDSPSRP